MPNKQIATFLTLPKARSSDLSPSLRVERGGKYLRHDGNEPKSGNKIPRLITHLRN
jgi:hypothetical protein